MKPDNQHHEDIRWLKALELGRRGEVLQEEVLLRDLLQQQPTHGLARMRLCELMIERDQLEEALTLLDDVRPTDEMYPDLALTQGQLQWQLGQWPQSIQTLQSLTDHVPADHVAWLFLGEVLSDAGRSHEALRARHKSIRLAQQQRRWLSAETTEPQLLEPVTRAISHFNQGRKDWLYSIYEHHCSVHGPQALRRVHKALQGYLGEIALQPQDARQKPKFFYMPDLPEGPYHDPALQPWCNLLKENWQVIRQEACRVLAEDTGFESFLGLKPGQAAPEYVSGDSATPAWDAFFFYRHGQRFDANHRRCPQTSALLESMELCRIRHQAPEICFSLLRAQSTIMPHYGVTNTRLVFHLPLVVPDDCALHIVDGDAHAWIEGQPMMFDDTYQHGAWNRSAQDRMILLMDCWNPHLSPPERELVKALIEAIDFIEN